MRVLSSDSGHMNFLVKTFARDVRTNAHLGPNVELVFQEFRKDNIRAGELRVAPKRDFSNVAGFKSVKEALDYARKYLRLGQG
jgi:hypothetical protein